MNEKLKLGVGAKFATACYGLNRVDWSHIPAV
jgi:hypothetical protein